jgi:G3E family GTPase
VNRRLRREIDEGRRVAVLINEFGSMSVDGALVNAERPEIAGIANLVNGCVCCSLRGEVVQTLAGWCDLEGSARPQRVLLETTGLADPTDLLDLEQEPLLRDRILLVGCLTVVSALTPLHHLQDRTLLRHQAALASLLHVSKADLDPSMAVAWESQLRVEHPAIPIVKTRHGLGPEGSPDPWQGLPASRPGPREAGLGGYAGARSLSLSFDHPVDPDALERLFLRPPPGELLRAKGICAFAGWPARADGSDAWAFQWSDGRLEVSPLSAPGPDRMAVAIGIGLDARAWVQGFRGLERPPAGARRRILAPEP